MPDHRFVIGQTVKVKRGFGASPGLPVAFRITGTLPERNNSPQYRMRSDVERHDRVMTEADLEAVDAPQVPASLEVWR